MLATVALLKTACDGAGTEPGPVADALAALLADVGPRVVLPALDQTTPSVAELVATTEAWRLATETGGDAATAQAAAQTAWWSVMAAWQQVEVLQIGPASSTLTAVGGEDLRDQIYSWPTVNRCRVDQETVYEGWNEADFFETSLVNVYGLAALEVLLYAPPGENDCPSQVDINDDGSWAALGVEGVTARRAAYAAALAQHVSDVYTGELYAAWDPAGDDYGGAHIATAGQAGSVYESPEQALNAVFDALFYLETGTKDRKLGYAVGEGDCEGSSCIEDIESPLAGGSHAWIGINLRAFRALYTGGEGAGMDDLLVSLGEAELDAAVAAALDGADAAAAALVSPLDESLATDPAAVQAAYTAIKAVTDLLRGDVATVLALQIPSEAAGDSD